MGSEIAISVHDDLPAADKKVVDEGFDGYNEEAAPLHEVRWLSAFARLPSGQVVGGAIGRTWGECCELLELWVDAAQRKHGLGTRVVQEFERRAIERGCTHFYLYTFSFQAAPFYEKLGYRVAHSIDGFGPGIVKHTMVKRLPRG